MAADSDGSKVGRGQAVGVPVWRGRNRILGVGRRDAKGTKHLEGREMASVPNPPNALDATTSAASARRTAE